MRYFLFFSYDGTCYHGWQYQPNAISVQQKLQEALSLLLRHPVVIVGAGRTDTGVHARMMVAHFDVVQALEQVERMVFRLNGILPSDISVTAITPVRPDAHARFDAVARRYRYYVVMNKSPFDARFATRLYYHLDFQAMNEAALLLLSHQDFGSFCKAGSDNKTTICHVSLARWVCQGDGRYYFEIRADRFLRNMVRAIVGTLLDVGRGKITIEGFAKVLQSGSRSVAGDSVPAQGLFLEEVEYPQSVFDILS